jgi:hypothetical protein
MIIEININFSNQILDIEANSVSEINIDFKTTQVRVSAVGALQFGGSTQSGGGEWGYITGDIENQTDLIDYIENNSGGIESVTGDLVDNTDPANPIVNTPTFNEVLTENNETDGQDISISDGDQIQFDNYARIRKGATDAGLGGQKGVALVCSIDYELKWEAGRQYIMQQDGFTIREVSHNFSVTPTVNDDDTKGFVEDSRWILDNGDVYVCTDSTEGAAVWALQGSTIPTLEEVLDENNTSGLNDIVFDEFYGLLFDNNSRLREGTIPALGNNRGIALICGAGYELKWANGILYVMGSSGNTIRQSLYNFTTTPTATDDVTKGYAVGSLWTLDDGTTYLCTDATEGVAVWALQVPSVPTLQQVTDEGSITTNIITVGDTAGIYSEVDDSYVGTANNTNDTYAYIASDGSLGLGNGTHESTLKNTNVNETGIILEFPDKTAGSYTIATTDEITNGTVTSVGLTMPSAFTVSNSPITSSGDIAVTGAGLVSQYVRGDGTLANFPASTGGGASQSFYLNGSVSQGTFGGIAFKEMDRVPILGAGTDFTINTNGYIQSFITDANVPNQLQIPAGNWNFETYFSASSNGGNPSFYVELYKWDGATLSLIASNSANPEGITNGTVTDLYISALAVPQTALLATDRLAVRIYVNNSGRTIKLHTENNHLSQIITTFSTGITALNGLTDQVQNLAVGTSGTDFAISSISPTHTFNLPTASASNRGALSSADWSTFNGKQDTITVNNVGTLVNGSAAATPNDTDLVATVESSVLKKITWTNVKAFLKTYFDTLYVYSKAQLLAVLGIQNIVPTGSPSTTSNLASDVTGMTATLEANSKYYIFGTIVQETGSGGIKFAMSLPSGALGALGGSGLGTSFTSINYSAFNQSGALNPTAWQRTAAGYNCTFTGWITTGANAGTFQLRFASGTNGQTTTIYNEGTFLKIEKL